jgi:hypothetical protein
MSALETPTPPQALFRELVELGNVTFNILTGSHLAVRHWPAYYMIYVQVGRLCRDLSQATGHLGRPFVEVNGEVDTPRIVAANACLARIGRHVRLVVDLLGRIEHRRLVIYGKPALQDIVQAHFLGGSAWYQLCQAEYCAGHIAPDGLVLDRTALLIDPYPIDRVPDIQEKNLLQRQRFRLLPMQSRTLLGVTSREVQVKLNQVYAALGEFFVSQCPSVTDLLHPTID